jgi:hypothetical protein
MINHSRVVLENTKDASHCVALHSGAWKSFTHMSCNKTYISDDQLHALEVCIYHGIEAQVDGLEGELISQM